MLGLPILSISILLPLLSVIYIAVFVGNSKVNNKQIYATYVGILASVLTLICTSYILITFDEQKTAYQFVENYAWIEFIGLEFALGVDGLSVYFIFLTGLLTVISIVISLFTIKSNIKEYLSCFLLLESFCIGAFSATNLLLFYLFFEVILIPMYFIIGIWGGENKLYAAVKFFLYTFFGSMFFLAAMVFVYSQSHTFDMVMLMNSLDYIPVWQQKLVWGAIFIALAVKVPMLPLHSWLPDAHVQAPTGGSVMLAGILLKLGTYGLIRILITILPDVSKEFSIYVLYISGLTVIYASLVALAQKDMKKMVAYSSIAHMGYVTAGLFSFTQEGVIGGIFQMISHSIVSAGLFLIVGILYKRGETKLIGEYGGVASKMPKLAVLFMINMLASIGLPSSSGFVGELMSIIGTFKVSMGAGICLASGVILGAIYMLKLYRVVMFGKPSSLVIDFKDLKLYETATLVPLIGMMIYLGLFPSNIITIISSSLKNIIF